MSHRYRRVMRRLYLAMLLAVVGVGSVGALIGTLISISTGSFTGVITAGAIGGAGGFIITLLVRPTFDDIRDVTEDER